jgi:hypothetical protein
MKKIFSFLLQFLLFFATFAVGIIIAVFDPLHLKWFVTHPTPASTRYFSPDGLLLTLFLYVIILLIQAARNTIRTSSPLTTLALALALVLGFFLRFGFAG